MLLRRLYPDEPRHQKHLKSFVDAFEHQQEVFAILETHLTSEKPRLSHLPGQYQTSHQQGAALVHRLYHQ